MALDEGFLISLTFAIFNGFTTISRKIASIPRVALLMSHVVRGVVIRRVFMSPSLPRVDLTLLLQVELVTDYDLRRARPFQLPNCFNSLPELRTCSRTPIWLLCCSSKAAASESFLTSCVPYLAKKKKMAFFEDGFARSSGPVLHESSPRERRSRAKLGCLTMRYLCCQNLVLRLLTELWDVNYDLDEVASLIEETRDAP